MANRCWSFAPPGCAPACGRCPALATLHQAGQIRVIAINYDPASPAELTELARRHAIRVPLMIPDDDARLLPQGPGRCPSYLLDARGTLLETLVGAGRTESSPR